MKLLSVVLLVVLPSMLEALEVVPSEVSQSISNIRQTISALLTPSSSSSSSFSPLSSLSPNLSHLLSTDTGVLRQATAAAGGGGDHRASLSSSFLRAVGSPKGSKGRSVCDAGKTYTITSEADMVKVAEAGEEECLYSVGLAPLSPPLGVYFGKVLKVFGSDKYNSKVEGLWGGKLGFKSQCRRADTEFHMAMNFVANDFNMPALMYVGSLLDNVSADDYDDGGQHLFVDYTPDMKVVCPLEKQNDKNFNLGIVNDVFGISAIIDVVRYVGDTADGGHILLGKTFARNPLNFAEDGDRAIAFWYVINYDDASYPPLPPTLGPILTPFSYRHLDVPELAAAYVDFSKLVKTPVSTAEVLLDTIIRLPMGLPALSSPVKQSQKQFRTAGTMDAGIGQQKHAAYDDGLDWNYEKAGRVTHK
eukprot:GHVS01070224.1.p1 GENE.GHVS01070224.1~~GHVS01070224.1.p1  ORF type:complete len:418 (+),score=80.18 GHVS01070224.1:360-1613(+)